MVLPRAATGTVVGRHCECNMATVPNQDDVSEAELFRDYLSTIRMPELLGLFRWAGLDRIALVATFTDDYLRERMPILTTSLRDRILDAIERHPPRRGAERAAVLRREHPGVDIIIRTARPGTTHATRALFIAENSAPGFSMNTNQHITVRCFAIIQRTCADRRSPAEALTSCGVSPSPHCRRATRSRWPTCDDLQWRCRVTRRTRRRKAMSERTTRIEPHDAEP